MKQKIQITVDQHLHKQHVKILSRAVNMKTLPHIHVKTLNAQQATCENTPVTDETCEDTAPKMCHS